jgi:hypothetical protein
MEETRRSPFAQSAMNGGAIMGFALVIYDLLLYFLNLSLSPNAGYVNYVILAAALYITSKLFRDKELGGFITYGNAFKFGVVVSLYASIIIAFFTFIKLNFIDPDLIERQLQMAESMYLEKGMSEDQVATAMTMARKLATPLFTSSMLIISFTIQGALVSLLTSAFIMKKGNEFQDTMKNIKPEQPNA